MSTVKNADKIIVLHEGQLIEEGTHSQLQLLKGRYQMLWEQQVGVSEVNEVG